MTFTLHSYEIAVRGHATGIYHASSRSRAKAAAFRPYELEVAA